MRRSTVTSFAGQQLTGRPAAVGLEPHAQRLSSERFVSLRSEQDRLAPHGRRRCSPTLRFHRGQQTRFPNSIEELGPKPLPARFA